MFEHINHNLDFKDKEAFKDKWQKKSFEHWKKTVSFARSFGQDGVEKTSDEHAIDLGDDALVHCEGNPLAAESEQKQDFEPFEIDESPTASSMRASALERASLYKEPQFKDGSMGNVVML